MAASRLPHRPPKTAHQRTGRRRLTAACAVALAILAAPSAATASPTPADAPRGVVVGADSQTAVRGSYVVALKESTVRASTARGADLMGRYGGTVKRTYTHAFHGYSATLSEDGAARLAADPLVDKVYQDQRFSANAVQPDPPNWGLDRIDQTELPLDASYTYPDTAGDGVTVYVIDTGLRVTHQDFGGRARHGYDAVDDDRDVTDGNGHGTHVSSTAVGAEHGVAKRATVVGVRVLDDQGSGSTEQVIAGIDWVTQHASGPSVANMSLGGRPDQALDRAVRNAIDAGITFTVAAGNSGQDARLSSPARVTEAITVGATDRRDHRAFYSNFGPALDLFAPGSGISAGWHTADDATRTLSGTSMASPHAAGVAALHLADHPQATPDQVATALVNAATPDVVGSPGPGSPNRLLHTVP